MTAAKMCIGCFWERFGQGAKAQILTWSAVCSVCQRPTPPYGLLIKADIADTEGSASQGGCVMPSDGDVAADQDHTSRMT